MTLLVLAPLRLEAAALRWGRPGLEVRRTGMGPARARAAAEVYRRASVDVIAVAGFCGAISPTLLAGDVVLASELRELGGATRTCPADAPLADALRRLGLRVTTGPISCSERILGPAERAALRASGAVAVDTESAWLAEAAGNRPFAVLRVVSDVAGRRLIHPRTVPAGFRALRSLRRSAGALAEWAVSPDLQESLHPAVSREAS
jgi:4-hydroxy-3-methylbut-2-en-1-yl diphosphate reductase